MTQDNRTSQAVQNILSTKSEVSMWVEIQENVIQAIAEKYKRMEAVIPKALAKLAVYRKQTKGEYAGGPEYSKLKKELEEALSFDPLTHD